MIRAGIHGIHGVAYNVIPTPGRHDVLPPIMFTVNDAGGFSYNDYFTADEARFLAERLSSTADDADRRAAE